MNIFRYEQIDPADLTSTDLRTEAQCAAGHAFRITIYDASGTVPAPETAEAFWADGRMGIAWGADATWDDVADVESGIEMWLNDA